MLRLYEARKNGRDEVCTRIVFEKGGDREKVVTDSAAPAEYHSMKGPSSGRAIEIPRGCLIFNEHQRDGYTASALGYHFFYERFCNVIIRNRDHKNQ